MKIIGATPDGFIIQADEREVARLIGHYSQHDCRAKLKVGAEIKVNEMYDQLYKIKALRNTLKAIQEASNNLRECVESKSPVVNPIVDAIEAHTPKDAS